MSDKSSLLVHRAIRQRDQPGSAAAPIELDHVLANSYRDFHAKGFDYLCLHRSETMTVKVYFFDGDVAQSPEAVIPHDHRYQFWTDVLAGTVVNHEFIELTGERYRDEADPYERFSYLTPLNGGDGFTWEREAWLFRSTSQPFSSGDGYGMRAPQLHTITVRPDTVLRLIQWADVIPLDQPTHAYRLAGSREPPSLSGLYNRMDADHALKRIEQYRALEATEHAHG